MSFAGFESSALLCLSGVPLVSSVIMAGGSVFGGCLRKYKPDHSELENMARWAESDIDIIILAKNWERCEHIKNHPAVKASKYVHTSDYPMRPNAFRILITVEHLGFDLLLDISVVQMYVPVYGFTCDTLALGSAQALRAGDFDISDVRLYSLLQFNPNANARYSAESCYSDILGSVARSVMFEYGADNAKGRQLDRLCKIYGCGFTLRGDHAYALELMHIGHTNHPAGYLRLASQLSDFIIRMEKNNSLINMILANAIVADNQSSYNWWFQHAKHVTMETQIVGLKYGRTSWYYDFEYDETDEMTADMYAEYIKYMAENAAPIPDGAL